MKHLFTFALLCWLSTTSAQTIVTFYTTMGDFEVEMADTLVPHTTGNFLRLTSIRYYDGVIFHRIIDDFVVQGGDPTGTGSGGPNHLILDEFDPSLSNVEMTISMANTGMPHSGSSQFFFNLVDNTFLDYDKAPLSSAHSVFGTVVSNWAGVKAIGKVATNGDGRPLVDVVMDSVRVTYNPFSTGISTFEEEVDIQVYPNPITSNSFVSILAEKQKTVQVSLFDAMGREIGGSEKMLKRGLNEFPISALYSAPLSQSVYFLVIRDGKSVNSKRLVVGR